MLEPTTLLLLGTVIFLYASTRALIDALDTTGGRPGRTAVACAIPIACVAIVATLRGHPQIALGAVLASCVGLLSLVLGVLTLISTPQDDPRLRRTWIFVLPTAVLLLIVGFSGRLTWLHALALMFQGAAVVLACRQRRLTHIQPPPCVNGRAGAMRRVQLLLSILLALIGAMAAVQVTIDYSATLRLPTGALVAALMIAPALVLPIIGATGQMAQRGQYPGAVSVLVATVLINLCAIVPLIIISWHVQQAIPVAEAPVDSRPAAVPGETLDARPVPAPVLAFPMSAWRVDTVLLVVIGLLLLPVAIGWWTLGRFEAIALILGYVAYVGITGLMARGG